MKEIFLYSILYIGLFGFTDFLYHRMKIKADNTRKIVHICTGIIALSFPLYLESIWQVAVLCCSFLVLMFLSEKFRWFKSITSVERKSYGSWLFALVVLICFSIMQYSAPEYYVLPLLILTIADPLAALFGKYLNFIPLQIFGQLKTVGGSIAFFTASLMIIYFYGEINEFYFQEPRKVLGSYSSFFFIAIVATGAELFSTKGWDNLTIPLTVILLLFLFSHY